MKKQILFILFIAMCAGSCQAQILNHIDYDPLKAPKMRIYGGRVFDGGFDFEELPAPLKPTRVKFTLTSLWYDAPGWPDRDWELQVFYDNQRVEILGDSIFNWPQPHKHGDMFVGEFVCRPLMSGISIIALGHATSRVLSLPNSSIITGISFQWGIDEGGVLRQLHQLQDVSKDCAVVKTIFFEEDSVLIKQPRGSQGGQAFDYNIIIKPLPKINDTAKAVFTLKANVDIPDGCDINITAGSIDILCDSNFLEQSISKGQIIEFPIKFIPRDIRNGHSIYFHYNFRLDGSMTGGRVGCDFIFDEDGNLKYVNRGGFFESLPKDIYPANRRWMEPGKDIMEVIFKRGKKKKILGQDSWVPKRDSGDSSQKIFDF